MKVLKADAALLIATIRQTDLFPSMPHSYQKMYGGLKLLLKDLDVSFERAIVARRVLENLAMATD